MIWISTIQYAGVCAIFMVYPLIAADQAHLPLEIVLAIALLYALSPGPVGRRFVAPLIYTDVYLAPSLLAVKIGGLPPMWAITISRAL